MELEELIELINANILTGGRRTIAFNERLVLTEIAKAAKEGSAKVYEGVSPPGTSENASLGYKKFSIGITNSGRIFICTASTNSTATWLELGGAQKFSSDISVILSGGKSLGRYTNGQTIPSTGKTPEEVLNLIAKEYVSPSWNSFSISGQATTVEVGTTLSGSKTFTWSITANSAVVASVDIFDVTANATLLAATANDGSQAQNITSIQLNTNGASQAWRGVGNNTNLDGPATFNSGNFTVTSRFYLFQGAAAARPTNSAEVRGLAASQFYSGSTTFTLNTGTTNSKFIVALPPGVTITNVVDIDSLNANLTSSYVLVGTINVLDAGGTNRVYNLYEMSAAVPYSSNKRHQITIS